MVPQLHQAKKKTRSGIRENFLDISMNFSLKNGEQKVKSCVRAAFVPKIQQKLGITPGLWDYWGLREGLGTGMVSDNAAG